MSASHSPWAPQTLVGAADASTAVPKTPGAAARPVNLHDVMGEELAAKLQREEQEQWEREMEGRFGGDDRQVGWCFVEVPTSGSDAEHGVMSVVQQEVSVEKGGGKCAATRDDDPDYTFALELQAQEAEEYDRMRRQEASSMERIRVVHQENPRREEIRETLKQYYDRDTGAQSGGYPASAGSDGAVPCQETSSKASTVAQSKKTPSYEAAGLGGVARPRLRDLNMRRGVYVDDSECDVHSHKFHALNSTRKHPERKARQRATNASNATAAAAPGRRSYARYGGS